MRPLFEKVTVPDGASWALLDRRLDDGIPFQWHYHPEFELTLTLNSRGQRYIGDAIAAYDDGDLVLLGPNLPHTWCSAEKIDARAAAPSRSSCGSPRRGARPSPRRLPRCAPSQPLLARAGRGIVFSRDARRSGAADHRVDPGARAGRPAAPADAGAGAPRRRRRTRRRSPGRPPTGARSTRPTAPASSACSTISTRTTASGSRSTTLADVAALSASGFHRLFRRHTRLTVTRLCRGAPHRPGLRAARQLARGPIAHIADEVGYANLANFNRQFRALKGLTPREFRKSFAR